MIKRLRYFVRPSLCNSYRCALLHLRKHKKCKRFTCITVFTANTLPGITQYSRTSRQSDNLLHLLWTHCLNTVQTTEFTSAPLQHTPRSHFSQSFTCPDPALQHVTFILPMFTNKSSSVCANKQIIRVKQLPKSTIHKTQ
jgi:hypothetical protein